MIHNYLQRNVKKDTDRQTDCDWYVSTYIFFPIINCDLSDFKQCINKGE